MISFGAAKMDPLIIERILTTPELPGVTDESGKSVKAKPSDKIVLCAIARCWKSRTSLISCVSKSVLKGEQGVEVSQKKICDVLERSDDKITVALIARLSGYSWNRASAIIGRLMGLEVVSRDFKILGYDYDQPKF